MNNFQIGFHNGIYFSLSMLCLFKSIFEKPEFFKLLSSLWVNNYYTFVIGFGLLFIVIIEIYHYDNY